MASAEKRVSRKTKASWRKYINIKDVEDYLEEKRQEERIGSLAEKKDEEIFIIDSPTKKTLLTTKQRRKLNALKPPKHLLALENLSKVQDPLVQRDRVKLKKNGRNLEEEILGLKKSKRVEQSINDRNKYYAKLEGGRSKIERNFSNVWEEEDIEKKSFLTNQWLNQNLALHNLKNIGKPLVKAHESAHHKTSLAKALPPPHPGTSYNPSLKDHQDLINNVVERESGIIKQNDHLNRVTSHMFSKISAEERDDQWASEMRSEEPEENLPQENVDENSNTLGSLNAPVENKKKSKKARRIQKEQKILKQQIQKKKEEKKKITDIHRVKHITKEIADLKEKEKELRKKRKLMAIKKKYEPKLLSKVRYQEPEIEVNMAEDISGNLRNLKSETSLLKDRFNSLQKRNILASSVDLGPRKRRKVKRFVRSSHKE